MHKSSGMLFLASSVISGIIGLGRESAASWRGIDAAACRPQAAAGYAYFDFNGSLITTNNSLPIVCPIVDGSDFPKTNRSVVVDIDQNNPFEPTGASACYNYEAALGGTCGGTTFTTSGAGVKHISVASNWPSTDYGYLNVYLAPKYGSSTTKIKGYWWQ